MKMLALIAALAVYHCPPACAAGIAANVEREVGPGLDPTASSRLGEGFGAWTGKRRQRARAVLGHRWGDGGAQIVHIFAELREFGTLDRLLAERDPARAAEIFFHGYLWPDRRRPVPIGCERRAREIYREIGGR